MAKLNQVIAIEKSIKSKVYSVVTELHKACQKSELFNGFTKTYEPKFDGEETYPPESKRVQYNATEVLREVGNSLTELFDVTAQKDWANCAARGTVTVDDQPLLENVPATYLLFLEKQLTDLRTFVEKLPVLDENEDWNIDANSGLYKTEAIKTHRTKKEQRPIVLYDATEEHPAQTQLITEDVLVGFWNQIKTSGAIPSSRQKELLERIDALQKAVKFAREEANEAPADGSIMGAKVFGYLFK